MLYIYSTFEYSQIGAIEEEVHVTRTKTAGKDYLLKAYLNNSGEGGGGGGGQLIAGLQDHKSRGKTSSRKESPDEIFEALSRVSDLNQKLEEAEERISDLSAKVASAPGGGSNR